MKTEHIILLLLGGGALYLIAGRTSAQAAGIAQGNAQIPNTGTARTPISPLTSASGQVQQSSRDIANIGGAVSSGLTGLSSLVSSIGGLFKRPAPAISTDLSDYSTDYMSLEPGLSIGDPDWDPSWANAG
jgi:hypothetical protein